MTAQERQELRELQAALIAALARVTEMLGAPAKSSKRPRYEDESEAKERFIAP